MDFEYIFFILILLATVFFVGKTRRIYLFNRRAELKRFPFILRFWNRLGFGRNFDFPYQKNNPAK